MTKEKIDIAKPETWQKVLIVIDPRGKIPKGIGDAVFFYTGALRQFRNFIGNTNLDVYTTNFVHIFLKNNQVIDHLFTDLDATDLSTYDIIFLVSDAEEEYYRLFKNNPDTKNIPLYTLVDWIKRNKRKPFEFKVRPILPYYKFFTSYQEQINNAEQDIIGQEIFLSKEEKEWGEKWLEDAGVQKEDKVIVLLDTTSWEEKLLSVVEYSKIVKYFLEYKNTKILIFDEGETGKEEFYLSWFGHDFINRFVFVKKQSIRQAICILGSDQIKVVFGPSTGLLHCVSGLYNIFNYTNFEYKDLPVMICYISFVEELNTLLHEWFWWKDSLADCIGVVVDEHQEKMVTKITSMKDNYLGKEDLKGTAIVDFIHKNYSKRFSDIGMIV